MKKCKEKTKPKMLTLAQKLSLSMLLVLTLALSVGGTVVLRGNFSDSFAEAVRQAEGQHLMHCYVLESNLLDLTARGENVDDLQYERFGETLAESSGGTPAAVYEIEEEEKEGETAQHLVLRSVYSSFPWEQIPSGSQDTFRLRRMPDGKTWMLLETQLRTLEAPPLLLMTAHDVTAVFKARRHAMVRFLEMELIVLALAGCMIVLLSRWLTKPLNRLTQASKSIAAGAYNERTAIGGGDEIGMLSESFDVMAQAVQEKVDELELSVQQREDFMGAFTHELKTPMTAVIGYADTLRSMQFEPEQQRRAAGYIFSEAQRVEKLSENLLRLLGLRDEKPQLQAVPLEEIFEKTKRAVQPVVQPLQLDFRPAPDIKVLAERDLMIDLLYNLINNSKNAGPKDGCIHIGWEKQDDAVKVFVADTGCGIPAAVLHRVTEPFYMVDKSRARAGGGSGMGLALCRKIAELHGSELLIESEEGKGTRVSVQLALQEKEEVRT